ncbi:hypothetical protein Ae201684P_005198 [Aphanomyces euteiches]|nr:hypothetical protein Ae201684P_005198 [Aphanomyces euteiches]
MAILLLIWFCVLAVAVSASQISVLGVPGTFLVPDGGPVCSGLDLTKIGVCPGPHANLPLGSCCAVLPNMGALGCQVLPPSACLGKPAVQATPSTLPSTTVSSRTTPIATQTAMTSTKPVATGQTSLPQTQPTVPPRDFSTTSSTLAPSTIAIFRAVSGAQSAPDDQSWLSQHLIWIIVVSILVAICLGLGALLHRSLRRIKSNVKIPVLEEVMSPAHVGIPIPTRSQYAASITPTKYNNVHDGRFDRSLSLSGSNQGGDGSNDSHSFKSEIDARNSLEVSWMSRMGTTKISRISSS